MPTVPRVEGPSVQQAGIPDAYQRAPAALGGADQARAQQINLAGNALASYAQAEQRQRDIDDQARVDGALNLLAERDTDLSFGEQGFTKLRGEAALKGESGRPPVDDFVESFDKTARELEGGLGNERQKRLFALRANDLGTTFRRRAVEHMGRQQDAYNDQQTQGAIDVYQQRMGLAWDDPETLVQSQDGIRAAVRKAGARSGAPAEAVDAAIVKALSPGHAAVLAQAIDAGKLEFAKEYLKDAGAEMLPAARLQAAKALDIGAADAKAQGLAGDLWTKHQGNAAAALAEARSTLQGKEEDEVVQRLKVLDGEGEVIRTREAKAVGAAAWSAVMASGRVPASMLASLREKAPEEERQIRDWLEAKSRRAKADAEGTTTTGFDTYYGLRRMAMEEPAAFGSMDLRKVAPLLGKAQLESLVDIQGQISRGDAKAMESQRVVRETLSAIRAEAQAVGIDLTPKEGTKQAQETAKFMGALTHALDSATALKKAPLTSEEARRIGMSMVREGIEQGSGFFGFGATRRKGYEIATDPNIAPGASFVVKQFGDIPKNVRDQLAGELRGLRGLGTRPLSSDDEAAIERAYTRGVEAGRFR